MSQKILSTFLAEFELLMFRNTGLDQEGLKTAEGGGGGGAGESIDCQRHEPRGISREGESMRGGIPSYRE